MANVIKMYGGVIFFSAVIIMGLFLMTLRNANYNLENTNNKVESKLVAYND